MIFLDNLREQFNNRISFQEKRPGVVQVFAPLFHEDGDMIDIFIDETADGTGRIRVSDHGLTLMRLSYNYELDTPNKLKIFHRILSENRIQEENGRLFIDSEPGSLYPAVLQFAQAVAKVSSMQLFRREVIQSLFDEMLREYVEEKLVSYHPQANVLPIPERDDLEVDYQFDVGTRPILLFGVRDQNGARLASISCLEFRQKRIRFKSVVVHEDFENLNRKDRTRITNASDKQFTSLDEFKANGEEFFEREAA
ncbi:MAG TPA: DUF1828 domain-containing protein [Bryobacteraceae bacterium]|nr:DUF1828 domain-containing protein [Bryobacteraceae bacterium]